jgi:hypothetical protein
MPSHCHCGANLVNDAYHCLSHSAGNSEAIQGHNNIAKVIARKVRRAGGQAWLEPRFQLPGQNDEHTDIRIALGTELIYVDVSIVHQTVPPIFAIPPSSSLGAARQAEIRKNVQYLERAHRDHASLFHSLLRHIEILAALPVNWSTNWPITLLLPPSSALLVM